jgi:hypothetical protein
MKIVLSPNQPEHLRILPEAGLIPSERNGVELHNTSRCEELRQ